MSPGAATPPPPPPWHTIPFFRVCKVLQPNTLKHDNCAIHGKEVLAHINEKIIILKKLTENTR